ncbi:hypothetical protein GGI00_002406 [Coemansia sp. RSA 2681]|nr:hypothetical protein GGI00_002406 [Coemansia sp. RSA 2681]
MDTVANDIDDAEGIDYKKRRREDDADDEAQRAGDSAPLVPPTQLPQQPESKKRRKETTRRLSNGERRPLTGSTDFVKRFGLGELYDQFVRPYVVEGQVRRTMPDLAASDYLRGVKGAVAHDVVRSVDHDLVALVKAPPKSEFSRLELLPMASIRAAFAIGNDEQTKKPVVVKVGIAVVCQLCAAVRAIIDCCSQITHQKCLCFCVSPLSLFF